MSARIEIDMTDGEGNVLSPEEQEARRLKVFKDLQDKGILVPDEDAPFCMGCGERMEKITVTVIGTITAEEYEIDQDSFEWVPGLHQFIVSPGFFGWVRDGFGRFEAVCDHCQTPIVGMEIVEHPHGLKFSDETRMAGNL